MRKNHPLKRIDLKAFAELSHVLVTPRGDLSGVVDDALAKLKMKRQIAVGLPHFLAAGLMASRTDLVLTAQA